MMENILIQAKTLSGKPVYSVDTKAIRRGKANFVLMMTLTTADHYDWFIGKFPTHNFFYYRGFRVYRRNVRIPLISIPQTEINKLKTLDEQLKGLLYKYSYGSSETDKVRIELLDHIQRLTPELVKALVHITDRRMHYIGEIRDNDDHLLPNEEYDLVSIFQMANNCADAEDAITKIYKDFDIREDWFIPVKIDERTHWGMSKCPVSDYPDSQNDSACTRILFTDHAEVLGEVSAIHDSKTLVPHTKWCKELHESSGADVTIPFAVPYPLWNLQKVQNKDKRTILLTDNLYGAYQCQNDLNKQIRDLLHEKQQEFDRQALFDLQQYDSEFEKELRAYVDQHLAGYEGLCENLPKPHSQYRVYDLTYFAARLLSAHSPCDYKGIISQEYSDQNLSLEERKKPIYYTRAYDKIRRNILKNYTPDEMYADLKNIDLKEERNANYSDITGEDEKLVALAYKHICEYITDCQERINNKIKHYAETINANQYFCWTSWFGGTETINDTNWNDLRGKDIVYVLKDQDIESYTNALLVLQKLQSPRYKIQKISFVCGKRVLDATAFEADAQKRHDLSIRKLSANSYSVEPALDEFNPNENIEDKKVPYILEPIISNRSITLLYAPPGIGKTWFTMCLTMAISNGRPLFHNLKNAWRAEHPYRIVYIDSEMGEYNFKKRLRLIEASYKESNGYPLKFKLVAELEMNLTEEDSVHRDMITEWLADEARHNRPVDLLILDNLSTLSGFNDSAKSWNNLFLWLKSLKERKSHPCASIVVHHSNKKGDQRGSSAKVATVDNVLKMEKQEFIPRRGYNGISFILSIEKGRDIENIPEPITVELLIPNKDNAQGQFSCNFVNSSKSTGARQTEVLEYLSGKKIPPHALIAALTGTTVNTVKKLSSQSQHQK